MIKDILPRLRNRNWGAMLSQMFSVSQPRKSLYIDILLWAYKQGQTGFTKSDLFSYFQLNPDQDLVNWVSKIFFTGTNNDRALIDILLPNENGNLHRYALTDKGMSATVDYLELRQARNGGYLATAIGILALAISIWTGILTQNSLQITQRSLELSAAPILSITSDTNKIPNDTDEVTLAAGLIPLNDSILNLLLVNNSVSLVEQVDLRMTLWQLYVDTKSRHLTVCPIGYVDHKNNPYFTLSQLGTTNLFNKKFLLKESGEYPFSVNLSNLNGIQLVPSDSTILLKIDANFVKTASKSNHYYVKLLVLNSFEGNVLDPQIAPTLAMGLADRKEEVEWEGLKFPSLLYPFMEEEFIQYFNTPTPDLDLTPSGCREFRLLKELRTINY